MTVSSFSADVRSILDAVNSIIIGKRQVTKLALTCLLAKGHLLIEDLPGVGKTTLAHTLASTLGLGFQRIQASLLFIPARYLPNLFWPMKLIGRPLEPKVLC